MEQISKNILLHAFPASLTKEVLAVIQILPLHAAPERDFFLSTLLTVRLEGEMLTIPYRVYFEEPAATAINQLTVIQQKILHCIYLRHHNGFVRQRRLEQLGESHEYWTIPYTLQLLGEYVCPIIVILDKLITADNIESYCRFIKENPRYWQQTQSRVVSYWHEYYRHRQFPALKDYPGQQLADRISNADHGFL
ncbi:hypothetical protein [Chitinophaga nivalis]|uniref:Uncharacterized protein n=1 Tax=Chitinophaga nivalis TaxID=2991709 RepID=A0ABT3IQQ3_9BACT|nr:hypothetical protein [Chitinophaga nivalis]MCW3464007.1 hypothetical protein [Chitinophaga nivalis]MCW3486303.1 hypothetical protein [Chitinophaga nivalis]